MSSGNGTTIDLNDLCRKAFAKGMEFEAASDFMLGHIERAEGKLGPAARTVARRGCREMYFDLRHSELEKVKAYHGNNVPTAGAVANRLQAIEQVEREKLEAAVRDILDAWTLPNGKRLGDATGTELVKIASDEAELSKGHGLNAAFYSAVASRVGADVVRAVMNSADAAALWREVNTSAAGQCTPVPHSTSARRRGTNGHPSGNGQAKGTKGVGQTRRDNHMSGARPRGK